MDKKKRIAIHKKNGLTMRLDFTFINDEEFRNSLKDWAGTSNVNMEDIVTYTLGTEEEMNDGNVYFCPRCGTYNEYAYEPMVRQYYQRNIETGESKPAGYYKSLVIDCTNCEGSFTIHTEKFDEEMDELNKTFKEAGE